MSDAPAATPPAGDAGGAPAPQAPAPAPTNQTPPPSDAGAQQPSQEDMEWDSAADELFPGIKSANKEGDKGEPAKPKEEPKKAETPPANPADKKPDAKPGDGDDAAAKGDGAEGDGDGKGDGDGEGAEAGKAAEPSDSARESRVAAREAAQAREATISDVRERMFADIPKTLTDKDGDPIESIDDVMALINPRTGEAFTEEEAGVWLLSAQQQFNQKIADIDKQIESIAETNIQLKEDADFIKAKYGEFLDKKPELRESLWAKFEQTLIKDEESGTITKTTLSLADFYETVLEPMVAAQPAAPEAPAAPAAPEGGTPEEQAEAAKKKKQERTDRSDIFGGANPDEGLNDEEKEWDRAATDYFGPRK